MAIINQHSQRWKTAAILLLIIGVVAFIDNKFLTWSFFGVVFWFALNEALKLFKIKESLELYFVAGAIWVGAYFYPYPPELLFLGAMTLVSITAYKRELDPKNSLVLFYPTAGILFFWALYLNYGIKALFWLLVIVALSDVGAYYSGKKFGKRKFSPTSPNKTLEGVFGGLLLGSLGGAFILGKTYSKESFLILFLIAALTSFSSIFGDLFESYLKREANVKDSGAILPGHGGVLDRIDGYLFGSITLYILLKAL
jgi:phosphatidate cytidylyltransferase